MIRISRFLLALAFAALTGFLAAPSRAAGIPAGPVLALEQAGRVEAGPVQYRHRHYRGRPAYRHRGYYGRPVYHHRPVYRRPYYGAPVYYGGPVYTGRRCFNRVRWVQTVYGPVRRVVRVCRW